MARPRNIDKIEHEIINGAYSDIELADMYEDMDNGDWCSMAREAHRIVTSAYGRVRGVIP